MNTSTKPKVLIEKLEFGKGIEVYLTSGDRLVIPYDYTGRLANASKKALANYRLIGGGRGVHFEELDEDISLEGILRYKLSHELRAS